MLLRLFRSLMPKDEKFVARLCEHSRYVVEGAAEFRALLSGGDAEAHYRDLCRIEEAADTVTRDIVQAINQTYVTPFDRSQILELATALDDTIDLMKEAGRRLRIYGIEFTPEMQGMADCAVRATTEISDAMPLLGSIGRSVDQLSAMQAKIRSAESEADDLLAQGLRRLFKGETSPGHKLTVEKVYDLIEAVVDRCEDVADVIEGIVVEQV